MRALFIRPADRQMLLAETPRYEMGFAGAMVHPWLFKEMTS